MMSDTKYYTEEQQRDLANTIWLWMNKQIFTSCITISQVIDKWNEKHPPAITLPTDANVEKAWEALENNELTEEWGGREFFFEGIRFGLNNLKK